jgi:serine/threonine protein kinase
VFLDDEPVGRTDPETGRLRLRELAPGRHRLRLSSEGRADVIREIDIATDSVAVAVALPPRPAPASPAPPPTEPRPRTRVPVALVVAVGVLAFLVFGLWMWRQARPPTQAPAPGATPRSGEGRKDSGTDESFPILFGEYSLVRRIGKGGMAVVYEATRRGESFALKRPLSGFLDDDRYRERFMREAELGRTLHHPNIIRIFDRGQVGDIPYFVMELIRGETLRAHLDRDGRLDATLAARLTAQVAEALDYAHNKGVIHRDLKPSNIMLEQSGGVKVMDYGVARAQQQEGLTTTGSFLGTPSYAAPETVDAGTQPQSDLYSLGVVLFEMLTGSLPFRGDSAFAILRNHATTPPPAPSSLNYALPEALDRLVLRLLSKEPSDRPTAEELLNELADFLGATR